LIHGHDRIALVVSYDDPQAASNFEMWRAYRDGELVRFQNQLPWYVRLADLTSFTDQFGLARADWWRHRIVSSVPANRRLDVSPPVNRWVTFHRAILLSVQAMALLRAALIATLSTTCCLAQTGTVTFYTPGNSVKSATAGLLPRSRQPFTGWLFDGPQRLAHVSPGRFMTFHLDPGAHSFTVPWHSTRPGKDRLLIHVEGGGQYCVRLYAKMTNFEVIPYERLNSQIEQVSCEQARREAAQMKPIDIQRVDPAVRLELDPATTFPANGQSQQ
jgi:hypothetical protein